MNITEQSIIGNLVAANYNTASVFKKYSIDFCCNGNRSIADACQEKGIEDASGLLKDLETAIQSARKADDNFQSWPLDLLVDYIEKKHHRYVEAKIQEITPLLHKVKTVHGKHHPELEAVNNLFTAAVTELTQHMKKEERTLFPFIRKMVQAQQAGTDIQAAFGTVQNPISMMMAEHDNEGERFRKIASLSNHYTPPDDACNTYKVTLAMLKEFEEDLHMHIHLENNILFPKSIILESGIQSS